MIIWSEGNDLGLIRSFPKYFSMFYLSYVGSTGQFVCLMYREYNPVLRYYYSTQYCLGRILFILEGHGHMS